MSQAATWLTRLSKLRVDRARGHPAPHKPLLLLSIVSRLDEGDALGPVLPLTPELAFRFLTLGSTVSHRRTQRLDIRLPFHHLQSDGVWTSLDCGGEPAQEFRRAAHARLDLDFASFLSAPHNRLNAKLVLIRDYFLAPEQVALRELLDLPAGEAGPTDLDGSPLATEEAARRGRQARFRLRVVSAYNYTCALTGYRLNTVAGATVVDAAHIHSFADSRDDDLRNGLSLSKTAHWLFDQGLWSLTDDCRVLVAGDHFDESGPEGFLLRRYAERSLFLPPVSVACPDPDNIRWHRENVFEGT